jgi:hypothetical protein
MTHNQIVVSNLKNLKSSKTIRHVQNTHCDITNHHKNQICCNGLELALDFSISFKQHWQKDYPIDFPEWKQKIIYHQKLEIMFEVKGG